MSAKRFSLRCGLLGLAALTLASCVAVPADNYGPGPVAAYGPGYYGYGDAPWGYGTTVNVYDRWDRGHRYYGGGGGWHGAPHGGGHFVGHGGGYHH